MKIDAMIRVTLTDADVAMLVGIHCRQVNRPTCSPQAWEVGGRRKGKWSAANPASIAAFDRLVTFGLVHHSKNGHCHLTDAGLTWARAAIEAATTMKEHGVTP